MDRQGRQPARERHARKFQAERPRGAPPHRARVRARPDRTLGLSCCRSSAGRRRPPARRWRSEKWRCGAATCSLCPATARWAIACRWASLPCDPGRRSIRYINPADPTEERGAAARLRARSSRNAQRRRAPASPPSEPQGTQIAQSSRSAEVDGAVRTALSVEPRDGRLCVFMPPVERVEDYLELVARRRGRGEAAGPAGAYRRLCPAA